MAAFYYETFADVLPFAALVKEGLMLTKDAVFFRTIKVRARDFQFRPHEELVLSNNTLRQANRYLGEGWSVWIDFDKYTSSAVPTFLASNAPPAAAAFELAHHQALGSYSVCDNYITLCYRVPEKKSMFAFLFSDEKKKASGDTKELDNLNKEMAIFEEGYNDVVGLYKATYEEVQELNSQELLTYLHGIYSDRHTVRVPETPAFLDYIMADKTFYPDSITKLDDEYVLTASVVDFPDESRASLFAALIASPLTFRFSTRFVFYSRETAKKKIEDIRATHNSKRKGPGAFLSEQFLNEASDLEDPAALAMVDDATDAMEAFKDSAVNYGTIVSTIVVRDKSHKRGLATLEKIRDILKKAEFMSKKEDLGNPSVFLSTIPGNLEFNPRKYPVSTKNFVHFLPQSEPWGGERSNSHLQEHFAATNPHMVTKTGNRLFYYNRNVGEVGHGLVIGPSGMGKSILLNTESVSWIAHYEKGNVITFDVDASSKQACLNMGGDFYDLGSDNATFLLNPFSDLGDDNDKADSTKVDRVAELFFMYFKSKGMVVRSAEEAQIRGALTTLATQTLEHRNFSVFSKLLKSHNPEYDVLLQPFVKGPYAKLFSNKPDDITGKRWIVFEMRKLMDMGDDIVRFCMSYIFGKIEKLFDGTHHYLLNIDEGWKLLAHPAFEARFVDWLRTFRKKHVYVNLATQNISELQAGSFETIANQCMHRVFLPNPQAMKFLPLYQSLGLEVEDVVALQEDMRPQRDYLYAPAQKGKQIFSLVLDEAQLALLKKPFERVA